MKLLKKLVRVFPFLKPRLHKQLFTELKRIDDRFNSAKVRYVDNLFDLYDCLHNASVTLPEDLKLFRQQRVQLNFKSSQVFANLILELRNEKSPDWEQFVESVHTDNEMLFINWYSNQQSIQEILDYGLDIIKNYTSYITYKDKILAEGEPEQQPYPPQFYPEEIAFFESRYLKMLVSDLITVYWLALDSNVSR